MMTLPSSFANIIDNLKTKTDLTYADTRARLLDLPSTSLEPSSKSKALFNKEKKVSKVQKKPNPTRPGKITPVTGNKCTWCNANGRDPNGHTYKTCQGLKEHNDSKLPGQNPPPSSGKEVVRYRASAAQQLFQDDNGVAMIASSSSSAQLVPPSAFHNVPTNYSTYEVWIFDTGASFYITADFSHLLNPVRGHVGLTVGGGRVMHATHQGNVSFNLEVAGSVISITLSDVLYVLDWNEASLIS